MIVGHHLIWTAYGWWLPNDPRGSTSHEIRVERIEELGELHYGRKLIQPLPAELRQFYNKARKVLKHELFTFRDEEISIIAQSLAATIGRNNYTCYACAIMPDHIHMCIRRHRVKAEQMIASFQIDCRNDLIVANHRPPEHPVWGGPGWRVFVNTRADFERIIRYIEQNPIKAGRPAQLWPFVTRYDGWMPRPALYQT